MIIDMIEFDNNRRFAITAKGAKSNLHAASMAYAKRAKLSASVYIHVEEMAIHAYDQIYINFSSSFLPDDQVWVNRSDIGCMPTLRHESQVHAYLAASLINAVTMSLLVHYQQERRQLAQAHIAQHGLECCICQAPIIHNRCPNGHYLGR